MLFNSFQYFLFFPLVVGIFYLTKPRLKWAWILAASYYFYASWKPEYLLLIIVSTLVDYWAGLQMGKKINKSSRLPFLLISLLSNLGILIFFKYFNFFSESFNSVLYYAGLPQQIPILDIILPVGISFYTFQTLAYSIEVYRGNQVPERHLGIFALYVSFFPQLVAGPIERSQDLLPQLRYFRNPSFSLASDGIKLIIIGLFKKVVIADRLAIYVNEVYNQPDQYSGLPIILATYFFAFQIYCDFSGYTDIAIGSAKVLGVDLRENFKQPYFSKSIREFWRRWHISLSTWFRDYLYIPLGGNRVHLQKQLANLFVVFVISGLWHGANWTFVIWGALHGLFLVLEVILQNFRRNVTRSTEQESDGPIPEQNWQARHILRSVFQTLFTFHLVLFAWLFFRANSLEDAFLLLSNSINLSSGIREIFIVEKVQLLLALGLLIVLVAIDGFGLNLNITERLKAHPRWLSWSFYQILVIAILLLGVYEKSEFIYFQF